MDIKFKEVIDAYKDALGDQSSEDTADVNVDQDVEDDYELGSNILHSGNFYVLVVGEEGEYTLIRLDDQALTTFGPEDCDEINSDIDKFMDYDQDDFEDAFDQWAANFDIMMTNSAINEHQNNNMTKTTINEHNSTGNRKWDPKKPNQKTLLTIRNDKCFIQYDSADYHICNIINNEHHWYIIRKSDKRIGHFNSHETLFQNGNSWEWWLSFFKGDGVRMADGSLDRTKTWHDVYYYTVDRHTKRAIENKEKFIFRDFNDQLDQYLPSLP